MYEKLRHYLITNGFHPDGIDEIIEAAQGVEQWYAERDAYTEAHKDDSPPKPQQYQLLPIDPLPAVDVY